MIALIVVGVMPSMLGLIASETPTLMLEVRATTPRREASLDHGCSPRAILVHVSRDDVVVGEQRGPQRQIRAASALQRHLRRLKDARPERQHVIVRVDDGVSYERVVSVLDMLMGLELQALDIDVSPMP